MSQELEALRQQRAVLEEQQRIARLQDAQRLRDEAKQPLRGDSDKPRAGCIVASAWFLGGMVGVVLQVVFFGAHADSDAAMAFMMAFQVIGVGVGLWFWWTQDRRWRVEKRMREFKAEREGETTQDR